MIRRTVAKAFGPGNVQSQNVEAAAAPEAPPLSRNAFVNSLFSDLQAAFERGARELAGGTAPGDGKVPAQPPSARAAAPKVEVKVSRIRPRPEGLEFIVEGPAGSYRFLNSLAGALRVDRNEGGLFHEDRLLTIHLDSGVPRAIERQAGVPRAPFRFTSVPQVAREFLARAAGG